MSEPRKTRVLAFTHSLSGVDGVGRVACSTLRYLLPQVERVELFIGRNHRGFAEDMPRAANLTVFETLPTNHFPFMSVPRLAWVLLLSLPNLIRAASRADVIQSLADYPMGFLAVLVGRITRTPVVVWGHGTYSVAPLHQRFHRRLIGWMYDQVDRFIMGARFALSQVTRVRPVRGAEVIPYGVVPADYDAVKAAGEEPGVPGPYVLCVGEVKQRKGYATSMPAFLEAWKRRPEIHFAVVGRHAEEDAYFQDVRRQIAEAGAEAHVHFLGNVSEARKVALMRGARAFMLTPMTSDEGGFEAFGLVFLEAGAAGRPVVGVLDSGAEDAITDGENGFIRDRQDTGGLADALVRLFEDETLADTMGAAGRRRAEGQTWAAAADRLVAIYAELLADRDAAGRPVSGPGEPAA